MKTYQILKLANLYSYAVSGSFDVLDTGRTVDVISKSIKKFLEENKNIDKVYFSMKVAKMAQDKFNQLVVPYLNMSPVDIGILNLKSRLESDVNQDDLQFFLHDLIHEAMQEGSIKKFKKLDEQFSKNEEDILEEMKEDSAFNDYWHEDEEGDEVFMGRPEYRIESEVYSLEDFIDEQVAESLTNKTKIADNGLYKYMKTILIGIANKKFDFHLSQSDSLDEYFSDEDEIKSYLDDVLDKIISDVGNISNPKYKKLADKFLHSVKHWIKIAKENLKEDMYLYHVTNPILNNTKNWVGANFNVKNKKLFTDEFEKNPMDEKAISDLSDDFRMSILRRWVLAVENEVKKMMSMRSGEQLEFNI